MIWGGQPTVNTVAVIPLAQVKVPEEIPQLPFDDLRVKPLPEGVAVSGVIVSI
jgi:hypothetical protein